MVSCAAVFAMKYTLEQKIFMYDRYIRHKSFVECCVAFIQKYPGVKLPRKSLVRRLVKNFRETGSLLDKTDEVDKGQSKSPVRSKLQTIHKTSRPIAAQLKRSNGPVTRAVTREVLVSASDTETHQEAVPFTFVGIKDEVENDMDTADLESDSDSDMQEPCDETQLVSVKEEPPDTSSSESSDSDSSDSDFKEEVEEDVEGDGGSDSDVQGHHSEARLVTVKGEPPDRSSSDSSDGESRQEPFACINIKQEIEDDVYVNGVQSDLDGTEHCHSEAVMVSTAASGRKTRKNKRMQQQDMFTSVKVECVLEDEEAAK